MTGTTGVQHGVRRFSPGVAPRWRSLVLAVALLATAGVGGWGLQRSLVANAEPGDHVDAGVISLPGGQIHLDAVEPDVMAHTTMPGMAVPDPLPEGQRRFRVRLTLVGLAGDGLAYSGGMFAVSGPGLELTAPKQGRAVSGAVPPGMSVSLALLFQVPEDATDLHLSVMGSTQTVALGEVATEADPSGTEDHHAGEQVITPADTHDDHEH